ncbi:hypothetical protein MUO98_02850 [Candidatus Bathyarchaeota archaeon]|nr:hypothetical protein [Candidatus Bathyarchaeota archaeon]
MSRIPISKIHVVRFFQLLKGRRFAEAERVLERIRQKTNQTEWNSGYLHALDGVILAQKSNDSYAFIKNVNFEDEKELKKSRKEFLKEYKNKIHSDYDRGFFAAWADYMLITVKDMANTETDKEPIETNEDEGSTLQTEQAE